MPFSSLRLGAALLMAASMMLPSGAGARPGRDRGDPAASFSRSYDDRDRAGYRRGMQDLYARERDEPQDRHVPMRDEQCRRETGGTILSAVAGGLLGDGGMGRHAAANHGC